MSTVTVDESVIAWAVQAHAFLQVASAPTSTGKTMFVDPEIAAKVTAFIKNAPDGLILTGSLMALTALAAAKQAKGQ